jgi:hypothetical protein
MMACLLLIALALLFSPPLRLAAQPQSPAPTLSDLAFLAGTWETTANGRHTEEYWTSPASDLMLGMGRDVANGKTVSFEFFRIESRDDGIFYVAQVRGRPGVDFRLASVKDQQAVFVNPGHADHLKQIIYKMNSDGTLNARIEGADDGKPFSYDWKYKRMKNN